MPLLFYLPLIIWTGCSRSRMAKHGPCQSQGMTGDSTIIERGFVLETVLVFRGVLHLGISLAFSSRYQRILFDVLFVMDDTAHPVGQT